MIIRLKINDEPPYVRPYRRGSSQTLYKSALSARAGCAGSIGMALTRESAFLSVDALPEPLEATRVRKVPTGIADLDSIVDRSEEHTSELQSRLHLVCRLLLEKKKT